MTHDAKSELAAALADDDSGAALRALRWAFVWSAQATSIAGKDQESATAIRTVGLLDDALSQVDMLAREVPQLVAAAQPGPAVEEYVDTRRRELLELQAGVARTRSAFEELAGIERQLRDRAAEHEELRHKVRELRRLERLVRALDGLQGKRHELEDRLVALAETVEEPERAAAIGATRLLRLSKSQRAALDVERRQILAELEATQTELADEEERLQRDKTELAEALGRYERLRPEREERLAALEVYARTDRELIDRLLAIDPPDQGGDRPDLWQAWDVLGRVEQMLRQVDDAIVRALEAHERARDQAHAVLRWSDARDPTPE